MLKRIASNAGGRGLRTVFPLIEISGPAGHRGADYGSQTGERIARGLGLYRDELDRRGIAWSRALDYARQLTPAIEQYDAELMAEIVGIARGSEQSVESIVVLNARTEIMYLSSEHSETPSRAELQGEMMEECTAALTLPSVTAGQKVLHGQNWDWRPECAETSVVLHIHSQDGPHILTLAEAGQLARHGMNSAGVTLTANGLTCDQDAANIGIPTPIVRRRMLMANSLAGAFGVLVNANRSSSHNIMIGHRDGEAIGVEATPQDVFWLRPEHGIMTHANHFKSVVALVKVRELGLHICPESLYRDSRVEAHLRQDQAAGITIASFQRAFADEYGAPDSVCRHPAPRKSGSMSATVASLIMDSSDRTMWLAPRPYEEKRYTAYRL